MSGSDSLVRFPDLPHVEVEARDWTPRLEAALEWAFTSVLGLGWRKMEASEFEASDHPWKLSYGGQPDGAGYWVEPEGLLGMTEVRATPPEGEDLLARLFWMGSRMEEHVGVASRDQHGRFDPEGCPSMMRGWLEGPVCEEWAFELGRQVLGSDWPMLEQRLLGEYHCVPTLDLDSAFAFVGKGPWRTVAALARDVLTGEWGRARRRVAACLGREADPYDTYSRVERWHAEYGLRPLWFFLLARFGPHDKGLPSRSPRLKALMQQLESDHPGSVQWHPGYAAATDAAALEQECREYTRIMGHGPVAARHHYLKMEPGASRRRLMALGIREDHTEGHAAVTGFRGGFSRIRPWYDLGEERLTGLMVHPFAAMDATLVRYMGLGPEEAVQEVGRLAGRVRNTGGTLRLLWHNESLSGEGMWAGWEGVYPNVLQAAAVSRPQAVPLA